MSHGAGGTRGLQSFWAECSVSRVSTLCYDLLFSVRLLLVSAAQGDILTVIRRVDEHWVEAKLGEKVGICPQQFVEVRYCFLSFSVGCGPWSSVAPDAWHPCSDSAALVINGAADVLAWMSHIPGHCPDATLIFIEIFDSSVNVTPVLQSAEAGSLSLKPCCVCSGSLVCDCVAYSGLQGLLSWLTVICFPLYFLPPGFNFIHAGGELVLVHTVGLMWCFIQLSFTSITCHLFDVLSPNISFFHAYLLLRHCLSDALPFFLSFHFPPLLSPLLPEPASPCVVQPGVKAQ